MMQQGNLPSGPALHTGRVLAASLHTQFSAHDLKNAEDGPSV